MTKIVDSFRIRFAVFRVCLMHLTRVKSISYDVVD